MSKHLRFDASTVEVSNRGKYIDVEITTEFPEEVLNEFEPKEIIDNYNDLDTLYEFLKEKFN